MTELSNESVFYYVSPCYFCIHYNKNGSEGIFTRACKAFTTKIPDDIWKHIVNHQSNYPGDHGIMFELDPDMKSEYIREIKKINSIALMMRESA